MKRMYSRRLRSIAAAALVGSVAAAAAGQVVGPVQPRPTPEREVVARGYTRERSDVRVRLSPERMRRFIEAGKTEWLDIGAGERINHQSTDFLPQGWMLERDPSLPDGVRVDSLGHRIVNDTPGLPAWSQPDVDALREAVRSWRDTLAADRARGVDVAETEGIFGNFVGQAVTRGIGIDDIADIDDGSVITPGVAASVLRYLHFYENIRFANQENFGYAYTPTVYPDRVAAFVARHGGDLAAIRALERADYSPRVSGCYARTAFARGITLLSAQTDIWVANGFDDEQADVPTGFPLFFFYSCQDRDNNANVRVSTNGYLSFFEQGGGAIDGTDFSNDANPSANDPDGIVAPWWDDLQVATAQGNTYRVSYKTEGAVDSRVFTVEWFSITRLGGGAADFHFFQAKLYETTGAVELQISLDWSADTVDSATTAIENYDGTEGDCGPNCVETNATPPPNDYRFTPTPRPTNDSCGNAVEVIPGSVVTAALHDATPDGVASCGASTNNRDVWYTLVARCNGTLTVTTCGTRDQDGVDTGPDTVVSVHSACPGTAANQLACSDDAGAAGCSVNDSQASVAMVTGQRVFVRVTHFGDAAFRFANGNVITRFDFASTFPPSNDMCGAATTILSGNTLIGNLLCGSNDGSNDCGSSATNRDLWYRFTAPVPGTLTLSLCGSRNNSGVDTGPDTVMSVHAGCPGTISNEIACNDDGFTTGCSTLDSQVSAFVNGGQQVRIRVSHFGDSTFRVGNGVFAIHADFAPGPACDPDVNQDGNADQDDVRYLVNVVAGGPNPSGADPDFNHDGNVDQEDVRALVNVVAGGPCP